MPDISIIIKKDDSSVGTTKDSQAQADAATGNAPKQKNEGGKPSIETQAVRVAITNAAKQAVSNGVSQYGNITGDYTTARQINNITSLATDAFLIAQGPVGMIAVAAKYTLSAVNANIEQRNKQIREQFVRDRVGTIVTKGSRY
jgi:hypothetical protein